MTEGRDYELIGKMTQEVEIWVTAIRRNIERATSKANGSEFSLIF